MSGFELEDKGSIPLVATVKSFLLVKMLDCESGNWVRIPASPKRRISTTESTNGYEPLDKCSIHLFASIAEVMELADIVVLETTALVHESSSLSFGTNNYFKKNYYYYY